MSDKLSKFATLVGQVALLVLEELDSASCPVNSSQIKEQLLQKRLKNKFVFQNEEYAFGLNNSSRKERWFFVLSLAVSTLKFKNYKSGPRGIWEITDEGKNFLEDSDEREEMEEELGRSFRDFHKESYTKSQKLSHPDDSDTTKTDVSSQIEEEEEIEEAPFNEEDIRSSIFRHLEKLDPFEFQRLVGFLFEGMGYTVPYVSKPGPDGGVDIIAHKGPIGVDTQIVKIQVKHTTKEQKQGIGIKEIEQLADLCRDDHSFPVFVSLKGFANDAEKRVRTVSSTFMTLIDRSRFVELWLEHIDNIPEEGKKMLPLKKVYVIDSD